MAITLTIRDESSIAGTTDALTMTFPSAKITVEDLIKRRVDREVRDRQRTPESERTRIRISASESLLNLDRIRRVAKPAQRSRSKARADSGPSIEDRYQTALQGFSKNAFFILVNDRQVRDLSEQIDLTKSVDIHFIKLVPLIGG